MAAVKEKILSNVRSTGPPASKNILAMRETLVGSAACPLFTVSDSVWQMPKAGNCSQCDGSFWTQQDDTGGQPNCSNIVTQADAKCDWVRSHAPGVRSDCTHLCAMLQQDRR